MKVSFVGSNTAYVFGFEYNLFLFSVYLERHDLILTFLDLFCSSPFQITL